MKDCYSPERMSRGKEPLDSSLSHLLKRESSRMALPASFACACKPAMRRADDNGTPKREDSKKRKRVTNEEQVMDAMVPQLGEETVQALEDETIMPTDAELAPPAKKSKAGRPPLPDVACEHSSSSKTCQKCIYRTRIERSNAKTDHRGAIMRILFMWSQNLVYFASLATTFALPHKDPHGIGRVCQVVDLRIANFAMWQDQTMKKLKDVKEHSFEEALASAMDTMNEASPASVETVYVAKWLLARPQSDELKAAIGETCMKMTVRIASLWEDNMFCPGISDPPLVEHFKYWKGTVWKSNEGVYAVKLPGENNIRSSHCTGFTSDGLCDRCSVVRRHMMKEKSAYKAEEPGVKLMLKLLPPGYRELLERLKWTIPLDPVLLGPSEDIEEDVTPHLLDQNGDAMHANHELAAHMSTM